RCGMNTRSQPTHIQKPRKGTGRQSSRTSALELRTEGLPTRKGGREIGEEREGARRHAPCLEADEESDAGEEHRRGHTRNDKDSDGRFCREVRGQEVSRPDQLHGP